MWRSMVVLSVIAGLAAGSSLQRGPREKKTGFAPGLATIVGTLGLLKIKAIFVSLIVFAVAAVFSRLLGGGCSVGGDLGCGAAALLPTAHSNVGSYSYDTYSGSGTGSGGYNYYNHRRSARGWDILDLSLEVRDCSLRIVRRSSSA
ncbi:uncharacterized protein LOC124363965 [Homalodisca vitripennis]|uniref:uncharacterized protein LOC124363965 n=1 Tax=Homalodisca vitripennis TaxID=197043 RepID=UPI001EEBB20B|nr:uncharacterized protein LOC124363965 [Homalodisca vitripennis]